MHDRPSALELLEAVRRFLQDDVVEALDGHLKYQARVAANVTAIVAQELRCEDRHLAGEWQRLSHLLSDDASAATDREALRQALHARNEELSRRIRAGDADAGRWRADVIAHLRQTVRDKLEVAKPPR